MSTNNERSLQSKILDHIVAIIFTIAVSVGSLFVHMQISLAVTETKLIELQRRIEQNEKTTREIESEIKTIKTDVSFIRGTIENFLDRKR